MFTILLVVPSSNSGQQMIHWLILNMTKLTTHNLYDALQTRKQTNKQTNNTLYLAKNKQTPVCAAMGWSLGQLHNRVRRLIIVIIVLLVLFMSYDQN